MAFLKKWFAASRPFSFTAAIVPAAVGSLLSAPDGFSAWKAALAILGSVLLLGGTNFVNDYYDHRKGADEANQAARPGAIQQGVATPRSVLIAGLTCFALGGGLGLILCATTSWSLLWIGVASVLAGFLYTGAPVHLAYLGLGEITVFLFMGPIIVTGADFVQTERWSWDPVLASLPIGFLVTAILHANNLRDIDTDRQVGKRTIATLIGREWANREMYLLVSLAFVSLVAVVVAGIVPWPALVALAGLAFVPRIFRVVASNPSPRKLNLALFYSAQLHTRFGAMMAVGLGAWWIIDSV
jgi:1,4-dihydroxy-2-naphthoate octaprenyltransferase